MRLPYAPPTAPASSPPETTAAYAQLTTRRAPHPLQALDLTLLHAPPIASGWSSFLGAIRTQTSLPADIRELCICRVAVLNGAAYEWAHHAPILKAAGVGEAGVELVEARKAWEAWEGVQGFSGAQAAVLAYADAMTVGVKVPGGVFEALRPWFAEREVVEITATVAAYNCVSRFLVALDVGEMGEEKKEEGEGL